MIFNIVGVSLFFQSRHGGGNGKSDDEDHMILSGVFLDTVADTLASLVVLVSSLGMQAWAHPFTQRNCLDNSLFTKHIHRKKGSLVSCLQPGCH
jgi:hypothetical protein